MSTTVSESNTHLLEARDDWDFQSVFELMGEYAAEEHGYTTYRIPSAEDLRAQFPFDQSALFLLVIEGKAAGYLTLKLYGEEGRIEQFFVRDGYRGQGWAKSMIESAEMKSWLLDEERVSVMLNKTCKLKPLFERLGYALDQSGSEQDLWVKAL